MMIQYTSFWISLVRRRGDGSTFRRAIDIPAPQSGRPKEDQPPQTDGEEPRKNVKRQYRQNKALTDYKHRPAWETRHIVVRPCSNEESATLDHSQMASTLRRPMANSPSRALARRARVPFSGVLTVNVPGNDCDNVLYVPGALNRLWESGRKIPCY
jgi:hypothetical protein